MTPEEAERLEDAGDLARAMMMWKHLAEKESSPVFFCRAGTLASDLDQWEHAERLYEKALELDPHYVLALECLGQLWIDRGDRDRSECLQAAKEFFLRALREEPNERVLTSLGAVYEYLEQTADAKLLFEEALRTNPNYEEAMFNLAKNIQSEDPEKSVLLLNRAIEIDPNYAPAHRELGVRLVRNRNLVEAEYHLRRALELNPSDYWGHMQLANLLGLQRRNVEAEETYRFATRLHPEIQEGTEIFARFLDSIGKPEEARKIRDRLISE